MFNKTFSAISEQPKAEPDVLQGPPKLAGLSTLEYQVDSDLKYHSGEVASSLVELSDRPMTSLLILELQITLPYLMLVEQIELKFKDLVQFQKYLTLVGVSKQSVKNVGSGQDIQMNIFKGRGRRMFKMTKVIVDKKVAELNI